MDVDTISRPAETFGEIDDVFTKDELIVCGYMGEFLRLEYFEERHDGRRDLK